MRAMIAAVAMGFFALGFAVRTVLPRRQVWQRITVGVPIVRVCPDDREAPLSESETFYVSCAP